MIAVFQAPDLTGPGAGAPSGESSWWDWWAKIAAEPALLEFFLIGGVALLLLLVGLRLSRLVREARDRAAVKDYLLGVEQAMGGDYAGARQRLERVLDEDPENHHARLVYGEVLEALGERAEAHKHHLFLQRAFKVDSLRNDLALSRNLLGVGQAADAVEAARRAVDAHPDDLEALRLLLRAQLAAGYPEDAGRTGARLARLLPDGGECTRVRMRAAAALALAGTVQLRGNELPAARALLQEAQALEPDSRAVLRLRAGLQLSAGGMDAAVVNLLIADDDRRLSGSSADALPAVTSGLRQPVLAEALVAIAPAAPYRCATCGGELAGWMAVCSHCGAIESCALAEPGLFASVDSPSVLMDEVDANRSHVRRQLEAAMSGDRGAMDDLVEIGAPAVEDVLAAAADRSSDELIALLQRMGPAILPALFAAYSRLKERRLRNIAKLLRPKDGAGVMGRIVQGFGRDGLPYFESLLQTRDRDLRKVIIDFYMGLGDQREFRKVLEHFPPVEVIHRLNAASAEALLPLLRTLENSTFLAEGLVLEPVFQRDRELLLAIPDASDPELLVRVLQRRGYNAQLAETLIDQLGDPRLSQPAGEILDSFGSAAGAHLLSAFADLDRPDEVRRELHRRISAMGPAVIDKLCSLLGPEPSALDDDVVALLVSIGETAITPLTEAYRRTSLVEKFAGPLANRYTHRRVVIIRALEAGRGWLGLQQLRDAESDPNLKLRLSQALQRQPERESGMPGNDEKGQHGQAG